MVIGRRAVGKLNTMKFMQVFINGTIIQRLAKRVTARFHSMIKEITM